MTVEVVLALTVIGLAILCLAVYSELKQAQQEAESWRLRFFGFELDDPDGPVGDDFWGDTG